MTGILKVDQWKDSGDNALMTSDGAGVLTANAGITIPSGATITNNGTATGFPGLGKIGQVVIVGKAQIFIHTIIRRKLWPKGRHTLIKKLLFIKLLT